MGFKTVTGVALEDIPARLQEIFKDENAYKKVPGGANLTDISTGFMLERITEVFGLKGFGWNFKFRPEDMELIVRNEGRPIARLRYAEFIYILVDDQGERHEFAVPTGGANENSVNYVEEGARTSALGAALKGLTFQLPVYKNEYDHEDARKDAADRARQAASQNRQTAPKTNGNGGQNKPAQASAPAAVAAPAPVAVAVSDEVLTAALKATVPNGIPLAGQSFEKAMGDNQFGVWVLTFLAKEVPNRAGKYFEPASKADEDLVQHAQVVLAHMRKAQNN